MLPYDTTDPNTLELKRNPTLWQEVALDLCRRHGITVTEFTPYSAGTSLVAAVSTEAVIKIIQPPFRGEWEAEQWALARLPPLPPEMGVQVPRFLAAEVGDKDWSYIIMRRVAGTPMDVAWPQIDHGNRAQLMHAIGRLMAYVHNNSTLGPGDHEQTWQTFLDGQRAACQARHRKLGMPAWFVEQIPEYLAAAPLSPHPPLTLLTGEYTPFNLLVVQNQGQWQLSGMVDFADAFAGDPEYDLIGPVVFQGGGDRGLIHAFYEGYGRVPNGDDEKFRHRLMTLHLLHRFSNFARQVSLPDWQTKATSLGTLARLLWPS